MSDWEKLWDKAEQKAKENPEPVPMDIKSMLDRALATDKRLEEAALDMERHGDQEGCWYAMAARAENARFIEKLKNAMEATKQGPIK